MEVSENYVRQSKTQNKPAGSIVGLRVPPHSNDAEMGVLGGMLLDRNAISKVVGVLEPASFYGENNRIIFETILSMYDNQISVDAITLGNELQKKNMLETVGGTKYIAELVMNTPSAANTEFYSRIVMERFLKRSLLQASGQILENCYDDSTDALEELDRAEQEIFKIAEKRFVRTYTPINKLAHQALEMIQQLKEKDSSGLTGVPTGYSGLDKLLGGFQKSDLIIIAARPSMGKTALSLSIARNIAVQHNIPVAYFSVEMASLQLVVRLLSSEAKVNQQDIRTGNIRQNDYEKIIAGCGVLGNAPLYIDDSPAMSMMELKAKCRRLKAEHKIEIVMIDYLQLLHAPAESREREISLISRSLKQMAKELNIPVVAMAQLNRSVEGRPDKRPMLSDLRESGSIEQDADVVMFINRPEVYGKLTYDDNTPTEGTGEVIVGKQRNGAIGTVRLAFVKDYARFENLALDDMIPPDEMSPIGGNMHADEVPF
ncbi:MAG: replicative DNA helicase [Candidatus Kapabacteria bacterium]|nr:replicative DNA helicase [Candidatus Kapabacteria bacterium]